MTCPFRLPKQCVSKKDLFLVSRPKKIIFILLIYLNAYKNKSFKHLLGFIYDLRNEFFAACFQFCFKLSSIGESEPQCGIIQVGNNISLLGMQLTFKFVLYFYDLNKCSQYLKY